MAEVVTLDFLAAQQRWMLDEIASMRDDIRVPTAIVLRHETMLLRLDETLNGVLEQMRAMVAQNARVVDRLRAVDERVTRLEEQTP
ncbi:MAG TPA: hypothetical protein VGR45_11165 [Stellaceae bacterium]|nr:hypothetical protein [Stellaceae bacterium]